MPEKSEYQQIIDNAIASYQKGEITQQDMLDIWRRAGMDAELENVQPFDADTAAEQK